MGFITKLLSGIFAFLGGLFGSLGKLLGFKKSEYFLELDDSKGTKSAESNPPAKAAPAEAQSASSQAAQPQPAKASTVKKPAPQPVSQPAQAKKTEPSVAVAEANNNKAPSQEKAPSQQPSQPKVSPTFATDFAMQTPSSNGRRRPGPSMNYFLDMAKQVKT